MAAVSSVTWQILLQWRHVKTLYWTVTSAHFANSIRCAFDNIIMSIIPFRSFICSALNARLTQSVLDSAITYHFFTGFLYKQDGTFFGFYLLSKFHQVLNEIVNLNYLQT